MRKLTITQTSAQVKSFDGEDNVKTFGYNKEGKVSSTKDVHESGVEHETKQYYDANGNVAYTIDGKSNLTVYWYNEQNNLTSVYSYENKGINANGEVDYKFTNKTWYTYDKNGNMKSQQYNGVTAANFYYNARNLLMKKEYPGTTGNVVTYEYYADGQLSKKTDRNNIKTQYIYNPQGLVLEEKATLFTVNNSGQEVEQSHTMKSFVYDDAGNQLESSITSSTLTTNETVERTYDELGRVKTKSVSNIEGKVKYVYDIITSDGLTAETSVDQKNNVTTKVYDKAGRIAFVKNGNIEAENAAEYRYYKNGAAQSIIYANGAREDYTYFDDELLKTLDNKKPDGTLIES